MIRWSATAWAVSVAPVVVSGAVAAREGHWRRRPGLDVGFVNHGGMWGDALLLAMANAVIAPWIEPGSWLVWPALAATAASVTVHAWWHGGESDGARDHMWPARPHRHWAGDLSWAGWCHVAYVAGELTLLLAYAATAMPGPAVVVVTALLSVHVPIGLLQPAWFATGRLGPSGTGLMAAALGAVWIVGGAKL